MKMNGRIQVFDSSGLDRSSSIGKVFQLHESLEKLFEEISNKFGREIKCLYTREGAEIDTINLIRNDDILYLSSHTIKTVVHLKSLCIADINDRIKLNIGGKCFCTTSMTLTNRDSESMLSKMFKENKWLNTTDENGAFLIDRSPQYFNIILNYLRSGKLIVDDGTNLAGLLDEANFYGLTNLIEELETLIKNKKRIHFEEPLTRQMVIQALLSTPSKCELRFQGVDFSGSDLSKLDLRYINFKLANLSNCNLTQANLYCCSLERVDITGSILDGANLQGVRMICCNADGSSMKGCNFDDPSGLKANMEGANMKGVNFEGSLMSGTNLRVATLKNSNLKNCDLRGAILAGTDLENCDLSGCDLFEANLRGCNVTGTKFEEMINPLHMTQTVP